MKTSILGLLFLLNIGLFSQKIEKCATTHYLNHYQKHNSTTNKNVAKVELEIQKWAKTHKNLKTTTNYEIPVVFHVVYKNVAHNVTDATVLNQLDILNKDFSKTNVDANNIRAIFDTITADAGIQFKLAAIDPEGNPTTGITHTQTTESFGNALFGDFDKMKYDSTGGKEAWDTDKYLNIWIVDLSNALLGGEALLGFASLPGIPDVKVQGVVLHWRAVGDIGESINLGTGNILMKGRTATHEVGHFFGLRHIWGDEGDVLTGAPGNCDSTDYVYDTPMANSASQYNCNLTSNTCTEQLEGNFWGAVNPPNMVENFMDYSGDACMIAFTKGQRDRMHGVLNTVRKSLANSTVPVLTSINSNKSIQDVRIFPNPTTGAVSISGEDFQNVKIRNIEGKLILNTSQANLDLRTLSKGIYTAEISTLNAVVYHKIVLQ